MIAWWSAGSAASSPLYSTVSVNVSPAATREGKLRIMVFCPGVRSAYSRPPGSAVTDSTVKASARRTDSMDRVAHSSDGQGSPAFYPVLLGDEPHVQVVILDVVVDQIVLVV